MIPRALSAAIASAEVSLSASARVMIPRICPPHPTAIEVRPVSWARARDSSAAVLIAAVLLPDLPAVLVPPALLGALALSLLVGALTPARRRG